ncbi:dihydrolipoamide branched chain transacylase [Trypanosoma conorhini]|uniref:Dihydrolipoamide acetyltransferase component of pyruvate dehydrogenase complex n=1 Tax=Trypanosoma conorhini TaxID=83891 RepID=A0A422Q9R1_9TRYP|nr:dihydrolipoamide branched chain transacylase [Trypanosoma conorhini]RNF26713.1 dihydrolipoamide branched chain transacylase [Trypanosoma conorhini]
MRRLALLWPHSASAARFIHASLPRWGTIIPYRLADIGEGIQQVEVVSVCVKKGDRIEEFEKICEVQSDKAMVDITSRYAGVIAAVHVLPGETALVGRPIVDIELNDGEGDNAAAPGETGTGAAPEKQQKEEKKPSPPPSPPPRKAGGRPLATPATREFARECGVDLAHVVGTGDNGSILKSDVEAYVRGHCNDAGDEVVPLLTGIRHVMVNTMTEAGTIPCFTACEEINLSSLVAAREELKAKLAAASPDGAPPKVSLLSFFIKAASLALLQNHYINAYVPHKCETLVVKKAHNIGFAVDTPKGLIVPVVRNVEGKSTMEVVREVNELVRLSRKNQVPPSSLRGGTFTISNVGPLGATYATPILLPPQVAISAFGRLQVLPRFDANGNIVKATIVQLSSTADHRVIDGATLVRFNNSLKAFLENPEQLFAEAANKTS